MGFNLNENTLLTTTITYEGASYKNQKVVATGGLITYNGEWKIHTFSGSSSFVLTSYVGTGLTIDYLMVGGGGGTGYGVGGGGGGGGVVSGTTSLTAAT
jgi:hypothetical protein